MSPFYLSIAGVIAGIAGVYFLAIEAIGIERLRALRESRLLQRARGTKSDPAAHGSGVAQPPPDEAKIGFANPGCLVASGLLGALTLAIAIVALSALGIDILAIAWSAVGPIYLLTAVIVVFLLIPTLLLVSVLLGMLIYRIVLLILHSPVSFMEYTERRYARGTAGLLGFLLIILALMLQVLSGAFG